MVPWVLLWPVIVTVTGQLHLLSDKTVRRHRLIQINSENAECNIIAIETSFCGDETSLQVCHSGETYSIISTLSCVIFLRNKH